MRNMSSIRRGYLILAIGMPSAGITLVAPTARMNKVILTILQVLLAPQHQPHFHQGFSSSIVRIATGGGGGIELAGTGGGALHPAIDGHLSPCGGPRGGALLSVSSGGPSTTGLELLPLARLSLPLKEGAKVSAQD